MQKTIRNVLRNKSLTGLLLSLVWAVAQAAGPLWTIVPAAGSNPTLTVPENGTATLLYVVHNQSSKPKTLVMKALPGIAQSTSCQLAPRGQAGSSCTLNLAITGSALPPGGVQGGPALCQANPDGSPNPNQCYQPSSANSLNISRGPFTGATITVHPSALNFVAGDNGLVTVANSMASPQPAENVAATIPGGSNISVQDTTCGATLAIGDSCTITFTSDIQEGPTILPIAGNNTNTVNIDVTVTKQPQISISNPVQQDRVVTVSPMPLSLFLEITHDVGSVEYANAITVSNKTACPNLAVNDSDCDSVAPGATCTLELTSDTPYAPCMITVSGSNTANEPETLIAFSHLGGLVFEEDGGHGKVVIDQSDEFQRLWTGNDSDIVGADDLSDGFANTNTIVAAGACTGSVDNCAAQGCRNIGTDWYLPARNELLAVHGALCSNLDIPCNFGSFAFSNYWTSSQWDENLELVWTVPFPVVPDPGDGGVTFKNLQQRPVRCVRSFAP
ncbi:MAG: DUF1566 domain-containing protein [Legionellaceae bacterium]|nr:DUF1566 domain-containing protein [Legionellaceae bacterium]